MHKIGLFIKFFIFCFLSIIVVITGLYTYAYFSPKLDLKTSGSLYLYDDSNNLIYQGSRSNEWANLDNISPYLINAVIAVEDKNFYQHHGFDYLRIIKALITNIQKKAIVQGASTISQQYIKNLYLDFNQTWKRKIEEAYLTMELEVHYDKNAILEGYLNTINYGQGNIGIVNAASYYFNKSPKDLTLEEAIILAGIPKNPSKYNPISNYDLSLKRAKIVAQSMFNNKYITEDVYNNLFQKKIEIYGQTKTNNLQMLMYYQDAVLNELYSLKEIPKSLVDAGGLKVWTNLNMDAQTKLEKNILENKVDDEIQVASVVVNPKNGGIIALTGGMNYAKSQFNRALNSKRQVGSTMKPFLYYAALENNMTLSTTFSSESTTFSLSSGNTYSPQNASGVYANKEITMAAAMAFSDNIYAIKTHLFLGTDKMVEIAKRCGIKANIQDVVSLPLGTIELNIIDFATGYTTFASGGYNKDLFLIKRVEDLDGNVLYEHKDKQTLVLNPNYTYILNEGLTATTNSSFVDYTTPTALNIASLLNHKYAIKTGSTDNDFWIVGYNPDALVMIWMGYDRNEHGNNGNIRTSAKRAWAGTIENILENVDTSWYEMPKNVIALPLDAITGKPTNNANKTFLYYYVLGSEPNYNGVQYIFKEE